MTRRKIFEQVSWRWTVACAVFLLCAATAIIAPAQIITTLVKFDGTDGAVPDYETLVQGPDGNFYGTAAYGGNTACSIGPAVGCGTVFKLTPSGRLTTLYAFCAQPNCNDGANPYAGLVLATDGNFYGTTYYGGGQACNDGACSGCGTVFKITPGGTLTTLHVFEGTDGNGPRGALVQAVNGNLYGTTSGGSQTNGTVFKITSEGTLETLHAFGLTDGADPGAGLIQATDGNLYGATETGGSSCCGTVFKITLTGKLTTLHSFDLYDGQSPNGLVQAMDGNFYGTTSLGGAAYSGTVFKMTPQGTLTTLYSFCAQSHCTDGTMPDAGLVQATDGNFYGTTSDGGTYPYYGTIFSITSTGSLTTLLAFRYSDGAIPLGGLIQATNGTFYGTTSAGGAVGCVPGCGTAFSFDMGLGPFVKTLPAAGRVGTKVGILGPGLTGTTGILEPDLTGATGVTFNGTPAQFTVVKPTLILTQVPEGATTGTVQVTLPDQTLSSSIPFYVLK